MQFHNADSAGIQPYLKITLRQTSKIMRWHIQYTSAILPCRSAGSCCELVRSIRKSTHVPAMVDEFRLCIFSRSTHGNMQWVKVIWPRVSHFCTWCLLIPVIHVLVSTGSSEHLFQTIQVNEVISTALPVQ